MLEAKFSERLLDALTLTEPLACVIHAYQRVPTEFAFQTALILGGGPIGVLHALEIQRRYPHVKITIIEPNLSRRKTLRRRFPEFSILRKVNKEPCFDLVVVATSAPIANTEAIHAVGDAGIVLLFSGLNHRRHENLPSFEGVHFESVHRNEEVRVVSRGIRLIGSSGFSHGDIEASLKQLSLAPEYYTRVQTSLVNGLHTNFMGSKKFSNPVIEAMLNQEQVHMAELKVLFRVGDEPFETAVTPDATLTRAALKERSLPSVLAPGMVRLKMLRSSVCQTDRRVLQGTKMSAKTENLILGHEGIGRVEAVGGQGETSSWVGKLAIILPHYLHVDDQLARRGLCFLSKKMEQLGIHRDGLFSTHADVPESCVYILDGCADQKCQCA